MSVHAVAEIVDVSAGRAPRSPRFAWPFRELYHGGSSPVVNKYGERPYQPLPLIRNVRLMPSVFFPGVRIVVDQDIAGRLSRFDGVDLNPCAWAGVYDLPLDEASLKEVRDRFPFFGNGFGEWIKGQLTQPAADAALPKYFEVIAPSHEDVVRSFRCNTSIQLPSPPYEKLKPVLSCVRLHQLYPVVTVLPYYLFTEEAWRVIEPYVGDPDLFTVRSFDLGD